MVSLSSCCATRQAYWEWYYQRRFPSALLENRYCDYWSEVKRISTNSIQSSNVVDILCPLRRRFTIILHQNIKNYIPALLMIIMKWAKLDMKCRARVWYAECSSRRKPFRRMSVSLNVVAPTIHTCQIIPSPVHGADNLTKKSPLDNSMHSTLSFSPYCVFL